MRENVTVDQHRPVVCRPAVHDTMSDRSRLELLRLAQPGSCRMKRGRNVRHLLWGIGLVDQRLLVS
jgi:hypothetical protein